MRLIVLGEKTLDINNEELQNLAKHSLASLQPKLVMSDFSIGWGIIAAHEAWKLAIPLMAVLPYEEVFGGEKYREIRNLTMKSTTSKVVFNKDYQSFLVNPKSYFKWVLSYADAALCYVDVTRPSLAKQVMSTLEATGRPVYNHFLGGEAHRNG